MTLLDTLNGLVSPQLVSTLADQLGESEGTVRSATRMTFATLLSGLLEKRSDAGGMRELEDLLSDPALETDDLAQSGLLASAASPTSPLGALVTRFLSLIFGSRLATVEAALAGTTGLDHNRGASFLRMASPLVMGLLADRIRSGAGLSQLTTQLRTERDTVAGALPSSVARSLGLDRVVPAMAAAAHGTPSRNFSWVLPVAAVLVLVGVWALLRQGRPSMPASVLRISERAADVTHRLPTNVDLHFPAASLESRLLSTIESNGAAGASSWIDFDRLLFDTGKATLRPESRSQLTNIAEILKAYPTTTAKIGGYTDDVGDPAANRELSQARAASVVGELATLGVARDRLAAEGYGETHPIADNTTEDGRAKNRRIALQLTKR